MAITNVAMAAHKSFLYTNATPGTAAASILTKVAKVVNINGPGPTGDDIDISNQDTTTGYKEFLPGLVDQGEFGVDLVVTEDEFALLLGYFYADRAWKIAFPSGATFHGDGYIKELTPSITNVGAITATATFKCSRKWTFAKSV